MSVFGRYSTRVSSLSLSSFLPSPFPFPEEGFDGKHISVRSLNPQALFLSCFFFFSFLSQWSSDPGNHQNYLQDMLNHKLLGLTPEFLIQQFLGGAGELAFLTHSQMLWCGKRTLKTLTLSCFALA